MMRWMFALLFTMPLALRAIDSEVRPGSITMTPANPTANSDVTICFDIRCTDAARDVRFAVGFAPAGYVWSTNTVNQINWVLRDNNVYRGGSMTVSGTAYALTNVTTTSTTGPSNGYNIGSSRNNWTQVCFQTHVPPEFSGNYQLVIGTNRDGISLQATSCGSVQSASSASSYGYLPFTVGGTPLVRLNMEVCNAGSTATEIKWKYRVTNWGEAGIRITNLSAKFCMYDTNTCWEFQGSSNVRIYNNTGAAYCNTFNPSNQASMEQFSTVNCGADGRANQCYVYTVANGPVSQDQAYYIPPNGGYMEANDPPIWLRICGGSTPYSPADDYSNVANGSVPTCGVGWSSIPRVPLYNGGQLVCEYANPNNPDPSSGIPHCGSSSGCNNCPSGSIPNLARNATGPSNVVCLPIYSPTPTPVMQLTKTADPTTASPGDTVTFTIAWANNASAARTMVIWDTIPANLTYQGCSNACSVSGGVITWNLGSQAAGASGSVSFWAVVSGYPFSPPWRDRELAT